MVASLIADNNQDADEILPGASSFEGWSLFTEFIPQTTC
jgi:hypothetical protein